MKTIISVILIVSWVKACAQSFSFKAVSNQDFTIGVKNEPGIDLKTPITVSFSVRVGQRTHLNEIKTPDGRVWFG